MNNIGDELGDIIQEFNSSESLKDFLQNTKRSKEECFEFINGVLNRVWERVKGDSV